MIDLQQLGQLKSVSSFGDELNVLYSAKEKNVVNHQGKWDTTQMETYVLQYQRAISHLWLIWLMMAHKRQRFNKEYKNPMMENKLKNDHVVWWPISSGIWKLRNTEMNVSVWSRDKYLGILCGHNDVPSLELKKQGKYVNACVPLWTSEDWCFMSSTWFKAVKSDVNMKPALAGCLNSANLFCGNLFMATVCLSFNSVDC